MTTNVLLVYPRPSISSPQKSAPLSILHVGEALKQARARWRRALIWPLEELAAYRWKKRWFSNYELENAAVERLLKWASARGEGRAGVKPRDVDIADWGVRDGDMGMRGEYTTGELD